MPYGKKKIIYIPEPSEKLAEFLGIFLGDGGFRSDFQISVSYNYKTEQAYADYVCKLIFSLFGLQTRRLIRPNYGSADLVVNSRALVQFLCDQGIVKGDKIAQATCFPPWVFESEDVRRGAVRGLFDTDGCIYRHSYQRNGILYQYPKIAFTSYSRIVRSQFFELLVQLQFNPK